MTTVTMLLPTNRLSAWVDDAVESLLAQDFHDYEILVIHDGIDVDPSREWTSAANVRCIHTQHSKGLASALAFGAGEARGEYLGRLDGDDFSSPGRLREQVKLLDADPNLAMVGTRTVVVDADGTALWEIKVPNDSKALQLSLLKRNIFTHSSVMFRQSTYKLAGGYNQDLRQMEDYDLWLRMGLYGSFAYAKNAFTYYRIHGDQMSSGAPPVGVHIDEVRRSRHALAVSLGVGWATRLKYEAGWRVGQYLRYYNIRRPGHVRPR